LLEQITFLSRIFFFYKINFHINIGADQILFGVELSAEELEQNKYYIWSRANIVLGAEQIFLLFGAEQTFFTLYIYFYSLDHSYSLSSRTNIFIGAKHKYFYSLEQNKHFYTLEQNKLLTLGGTFYLLESEFITFWSYSNNLL
jgi:hypothetical protein